MNYYFFNMKGVYDISYLKCDYLQDTVERLPNCQLSDFIMKMYPNPYVLVFSEMCTLKDYGIFFFSLI